MNGSGWIRCKRLDLPKSAPGSSIDSNRRIDGQRDSEVAGLRWGGTCSAGRTDEHDFTSIVAQPLQLARRPGTLQPSSSGMQAIVPAGIPGTTMVEGCDRNGNGVSEPISTSGFHAARVSACRASARNTVGGLPTCPRATVSGTVQPRSSSGAGARRRCTSVTMKTLSPRS